VVEELELSQTPGCHDNVFTTCCILHDILLEGNKHSAEDFALPKGGSLSNLVTPGDRGDGMHAVRVWVTEEEELDGDSPAAAAAASKWKQRIIATLEHVEREVGAHLDDT
jgi:hypothetical protein